MSTQPQHGSDEFERAFPDSVVTHVLQVTTEPSLAVCRDLLDVLASRGCQLESMHVSGCAGGLDHRLRVRGIAAGAARRLGDELAGRSGVLTASVEHQILRR